MGNSGPHVGGGQLGGHQPQSGGPEDVLGLETRRGTGPHCTCPQWVSGKVQGLFVIQTPLQFTPNFVGSPWLHRVPEAT